MSSLSHNGNRFEIWHSERTWFWMIMSDYSGGGAIGVAASEAEAIREARRSIEEQCADSQIDEVNT